MTIKDLGRWESLEMVQRYTRSVNFQDSMRFYVQQKRGLLRPRFTTIRPPQQDRRGGYKGLREQGEDKQQSCSYNFGCEKGSCVSCLKWVWRLQLIILATLSQWGHLLLCIPFPLLTRYSRPQAPQCITMLSLSS